MPKANESPYATTDLRDSFRRPNYLYGHTFREFSFANKNSECVFVRIVWYPDHVPEVSCSVRTFIRFRKKFLKLNTFFFFSNWTFLEISGKMFLETAGNDFQKFPETFLEISGNE